MNDTTALISDWRAALEGQTVVGTSPVQDRLLGLWGELGPAVDAILTPRLEASSTRSYFSAEELLAMLDEIEACTEAVSV